MINYQVRHNVKANVSLAVFMGTLIIFIQKSDTAEDQAENFTIVEQPQKMLNNSQSQEVFQAKVKFLTAKK